MRIHSADRRSRADAAAALIGVAALVVVGLCVADQARGLPNGEPSGNLLANGSFTGQR